MYLLDCTVDKQGNRASIANETGAKLDLWHQRMAHLNAGQMKIMASKELITDTDIPGTGKLSFCEACAEGKAHRAPFNLICTGGAHDERTPINIYPSFLNKRFHLPVLS